MAPRLVAPLNGAISRRRFLGASLAAVGLAACGGTGGSGSDSELTASRIFDPRTLVPDGTPKRTVWAVQREGSYITDDAPEAVTVTATSGGTTLLDEVTVTVRRDGLLVPYYPVHIPFIDASPVDITFTSDIGAWDSVTDARGTADSGLVGVGDILPSVVTPTFANAAGVDPICTRSPEPCPFHEVSLDEAIGTRPIALIVSTPAFCSNQFACGPVLELLVDMQADMPDLTVIHAEVYAAPTGRELGEVSPVMAALGAWYEPFMYVADVDGTVVERIDFMWDRADLADTLALVS